VRTTPPDRERQVLEALVELYVERQEPVSSRMLEESRRLPIRSASIRSVLHELERQGLLEQPHRSSGRVPTDEGYRVYADGSLDRDPLSERERKEIERALRRAGEDMREIVRATASLLGRFSHNIAIVAGPRDLSPRITGIEVYVKDSQRVLVVVSLEGGDTRTELVDLGREVDPELVAMSARVLAERLPGRTLDETRRDLEEMLRPAFGPAEEMAADMATEARALFDPLHDLQISLEGVPEALEQPEFTDPERLKSLLTLISRARDFESALEHMVGPRTGDVSLAIGHESPVETLHPFSMMATRFELSHQYGYLAVLGPRRMRYAHLLSLIRLVSRHLERLDG